jgi:hypothetical protein
MSQFEILTICFSALSLLISLCTWFLNYKFIHKPYINVEKVKKDNIEYLRIQNKSNFPVKRIRIHNIETKQLLVQEIDYLPPEKILEIDILETTTICQYKLTFCQKYFHYKLIIKL